MGMTSGSGLSNVLAALNQKGASYRHHGGYITAQCPAHDDRTASLSISQGEKGAVLTCHAGCETDVIRTELGLPWPALFDNDGKGSGDRGLAADLWMPCQMPDADGKTCSGHKSAEYRYVDEEGRLLYAVARCSRKGDGCPQPFAQWVPDASKRYGKKWGLPGHIRRVLYNLPQVVEAARAGRRIWLVEGEKDADRLKADYPGETVTTAMSGAGKSKWRLEYTRHFAGASEVIIVADCDEPGLTYAEEVHQHISKVVERVKVVCSPLLEDGADFSDHRNYGFGLDEFEIVPFETGTRRPPMVIKVEPHHREKPVVFDGYSQVQVERSLVGSMLKYGSSYGMSEADFQSSKALRLTVAAISRIAARDTYSMIAPETVAAEIDESGLGTYDKVIDILLKLEQVAFSDTEKPRKAAQVLRERIVRQGLVYSLRAAEEAAQNERWPVEGVLAHMRQLTERHEEEYASLARDYGDMVGDVFTNDVVAEVAREEGVIESTSNVRELRPAPSAKTRQAVGGSS